MSDKRVPGCTPYIVTSPLWSRAPARDEKGSPFIDFMMIIPGLKGADEAIVQNCLVKISKSLADFENVVAYVDLNIKLNLLWISAKPVPGISKLIMQAILRELPHAKIVAGDFNAESFTEKTNWLTLLGRRLKQRLLLFAPGSAD